MVEKWFPPVVSDETGVFILIIFLKKILNHLKSLHQSI